MHNRPIIIPEPEYTIVYIALSSDNIIAFIYYRKAFDSISQVQMFEILSEMGFPKHLVALLDARYNYLLADMILNRHRGSSITIERGVRKGYIISPHLFNLYTDSAIRHSEIEEIAINIGGNWALI